MIWQSELRCLQPRIWLQNPLSILCASCYTIRATQSNNEIAFEGITLVKVYSLLLVPLNGEEIVWQQ